MRKAILAAVLLSATLLASPATADVRLTISNGQVTLSAKDATVRQILAEWARVGQTTIVNAERVAGSQVTLELANVSEEQALDIILRSVSGYLAAPRSVSVANASRYDRILVLPTSTGTRATASAAAPAPAFQQPQFNPQRADEAADEPDDDVAAPGAPNGAPPPMPRGPIFNAFPPAQGAQPGGQRLPPAQQQQAAPNQVPQSAPGVFSTPALPPGVTMSPGVAVPGMVVPAPAQPGAAAPGPDTP
jgi:hypothetical protein